MWKDQEENRREEKYLDEKNFITTGQYGHTEDTTSPMKYSLQSIKPGSNQDIRSNLQFLQQFNRIKKRAILHSKRRKTHNR